MDILTNGNVLVNKIKLGDIHYEFAPGQYTKCEVISLPVNDGNGFWKWKSKNLKTNEDIEYGVHEDMSLYAPKLYDYIAFPDCEWK